MQEFYLKLRKSYEFKCCFCGAVLHAKPSIFMIGFQMNLGGGQCIKCKKSFSLQIDDKNEAMICCSREEFNVKGKVGDKKYPLTDSCFGTVEQAKLFSEGIYA